MAVGLIRSRGDALGSRRPLVYKGADRATRARTFFEAAVASPQVPSLHHPPLRVRYPRHHITTDPNDYEIHYPFRCTRRPRSLLGRRLPGTLPQWFIHVASPRGCEALRRYEICLSSINASSTNTAGRACMLDTQNND